MLTLLVQRDSIEGGLPEDIGIDAETMRQMMVSWVAECKLEQYLFAEEAPALLAPVGTLSDDDRSELAWRTEPLGTLMWALGILDPMPGYDEMFTDELVGVLPVPAPRDEVNDFLRQVRLRPAVEIDRALETGALWFGRAQIALGSEAVVSGLSEHAVPAVAAQGFLDGLLPPLVDGDFPVDGRAFRDLPREDVEIVAEIANERVGALIWLAGDDPDDEDLSCLG